MKPAKQEQKVLVENTCYYNKITFLAFTQESYQILLKN